MMKKFILLAAFFFVFINIVQAIPFIIGEVNDSLDGEPADGHTVMLWNPSVGIGDNVTDIIGPTGNSGASNIYMIDCGLLSSGCFVGIEVRVKAINTGDNYVTSEANLTISGAGFQAAPQLRLNSKPYTTLEFPVNFANISNQNTVFSCTSNDSDSNLANVTLYGNWSAGWHANETVSLTGMTNSTIFTKNLSEGSYLWSCLATDDLSISGFSAQNFTINVDLTFPNSTIEANLSGSICGTNNIVRITCNASDYFTGVSDVIVQAFSPNGSIQNYSASFLEGNSYYSDILLNFVGNWSFSCLVYDYSNNFNISNYTNLLSVHPIEPDLQVFSEEILFEYNGLIEGQSVAINSTIYNNGCANANSVLVGFFEGDPNLGGDQINGNISVSVASLNNSIVNVTWTAEIGFHNIFVLTDLNNSFSEYNETNNKANNTLNVTAWQEFYGNVSIEVLLANSNLINLSFWSNQTIVSGNIFVVDMESDISWASLISIGQNVTGGNTTNDFNDIDFLLNMQNFQDSVSNRFTTDGSTPKRYRDFLIYQNLVANVPIISSTDNLAFFTGILWDSFDDTDGEFSQIDREDIVFVSNVNDTQIGEYGTYDYELTIPVRLREYDLFDTNNVYFYFDLN